MRGLLEAAQFIYRDQRHVGMTAATNDNDFPVVARPIEQFGQVLTRPGVRVGGHAKVRSVRDCTGNLYARQRELVSAAHSGRDLGGSAATASAAIEAPIAV